MKPIIFLILYLSFLISVPAYAIDFKFKTQQSFRYDISVDNEDWYIMRFWAETFYKSPLIYNTFRIAPFVETRYHFYLHKLSRTEVGVEIGIDLFKWLYWGESLQYASLHPGRDTIELESILKFSYPFRIKSQKVVFYVLGEHTFAFVFGEGKRAEIGFGFIWQPKEALEFLLGWRHTDRIHYYDTDQIEASVIYGF